VLRRPWLGLFIAIAALVAIFLRGRPDLAASDPLWYATIAHQLSTHPSDLFALHDLHPFVMRLGLTVPIAVMYRLFGVSDLTTNLPALFGAVTILVVLYASAASARGRWIALGVGVFSTALIQNSLVLNVDLPCAALMSVSIVCLARRDRERGQWWLVAMVVAAFAAFLVKEVAVWCVPVCLIAIVSDIRATGRQAIARTLPAVGTGFILATAYLVFCKVMWGDALARFHGIDALTYDHAWALHGQNVGAWVGRLTWEPPALFAKLVGVAIIPALLAPFLVTGRDRVWLLAAGTFVLLYWFGSSSLSAYAPLPISPRMALPVLPPLLVCAALAIDHLIDVAGASLPKRAGVLILALTIALPSLNSDRTFLARSRPEAASFAELRSEATSAPGKSFTLVCAEPRCEPIAVYQFGFDVPPNVHVVMANDFANAPIPAAEIVRTLVNRPRASGAARTDPKQDRTKPILALGLPRLAGNDQVMLLDAGDGTSLWNALR